VGVSLDGKQFASPVTTGTPPATSSERARLDHSAREARWMRAKGWHGGPPSGPGAGYGIRISKADRDAHFDPEWDAVTISLEGKRIVVALSESFWEDCTELRSKIIGEFMLANGLAPWPKRQPPVFELVPEGDATFRLDVPA